MPHRRHLLEMLKAYETTVEALDKSAPAALGGTDERRRLTVVRDFVLGEPACFERRCAPGHVTGSAMVVTPDFSRVLLTLHAKLGKWLQLGGHSDSDPRTDRVALREAEEESGLTDLALYEWASRSASGAASPAGLATGAVPFDLDWHTIPARGDDAEHIHYDVRFIVLAHGDTTLRISEESHDLRWFTLEEARRVTAEAGMLRQIDKLQLIGRNRLISGALTDHQPPAAALLRDHGANRL